MKSIFILLTTFVPCYTQHSLLFMCLTFVLMHKLTGWWWGCWIPKYDKNS